MAIKKRFTNVLFVMIEDSMLSQLNEIADELELSKAEITRRGIESEIKNYFQQKNNQLKSDV